VSANGHDAVAIAGERARQEKRFAEVVRAIALAADPQWRHEHAHLIDVVRRLPRGEINE
jgi:hypothetical protein